MSASPATTDRPPKASKTATPLAAVPSGAGADPAASEQKPALKEFLISPSRTVLREYANSSWHIVVPAGTTAADLHLRFEPFAAISGLLTKGDDVLAITEDDRMAFQMLCVIGTRGHLATCCVINAIELPKVSEKQKDVLPPGYDIRIANSGDREQGFPQGSFIAYRKSDGLILIAEHYFTWEDCQQALLRHAAIREADPHAAAYRY
jgi:hypothetical protein